MRASASTKASLASRAGTPADRGRSACAGLKARAVYGTAAVCGSIVTDEVAMVPPDHGVANSEPGSGCDAHRVKLQGKRPFTRTAVLSMLPDPRDVVTGLFLHARK